MRRLFLFAPLLLLHCTLVTHAVTEHHRCMFHRVSKLVGAEPKGDDLKEMTRLNLRRDTRSSQSMRTKTPAGREERIADEWKPIRIKLVTDILRKDGHYCSDGVTQINTSLKNSFNCTEVDVLTPEKKNILVNEILPEAIKLHEERLFVKPLNGPIVVPQFSESNGLCSQLIPEEHKHKTTGVPEADMVLFVAAEPTTEGAFAWAATCATLGLDGRPVVGIINYGPRYIVATPQRVRVAAHEIAHALGFNSQLMERKGMVGEVNSLSGRPFVALVTSDNTRREAMEHYKCDTAEGMELRSVPIPRNPIGKGGFGSRGNGQRQNVRGIVTPSGAADATSRNLKRGRVESGRPPQTQRLEPRVLTASVQEEYEVGESHSNVLDYRLTGEESVGSDVQERRGEEGSSASKFTENVHHSSNVLSKRHSIYLQATVAASPTTCGRGKPVETFAGATECIVETVQFPPNFEPNKRLITLSHWSRRIAKDELMTGLVGAGYYTAITMGAFADLGYYKVNWTMAEQMSWGNNSKCEFLNNKCVNSGETKFSNMFCTTKSTDGPAGLQCTSDRQSLGRCSIQTYERDLPGHFQYFSDGKLGGNKTDLMDYCPFITAEKGYSCINGEEGIKMPGSVIANNSRCVEGKDLKANNNAAVGAVCVEVSCKFNKVIVRYSGNDKWYSCPEEENLTLNGTVLQGEIVCPKYADVCNTINKTLDESQGPEKDPDIVEAVQTSETEVEKTTALSDGTQPVTEATGTARPSESAAGSEEVTAPVVQNGVSTTMEANRSETKEESITSFLNGQNTNVTLKKGIDGSFKVSSVASVMFVFLTLSVIMLP
ncbi:putative surface protease GP63, putative,metallopeptidase [Trypanosoma theileri]|uniref:Leishmanolysin-like peptidase n=1 Tax=Trypanosoma theileri TaxID=67003 RepID=A0A1X0NEB0_9TRYP|nr:putative surface protease GP63, putative,metallopeptidase [Trypanosoma theileri]ORC81753.1 putative surface protease GP63, putative,metallopeptidase [Trypanosoma theileri]